MELLLFHREQFVDYLYDWIVISERIGVLVTAELIGNEDLTRMFNLQDKELFNKCLLPKRCLDEQDVLKLANTYQELDFQKLHV